MGVLGPARTGTAGGLQLNEASARLTGTGYSGTAALAEDASMAWYNPAGLTRLAGGSAVFSGSAIKLKVDVDATTSSTWGQSGVTGPYGSTQASGGGLVGVPNFHLAQRVAEKVVLYLGVVAPFGDQTNYPDSSAVRYMGTLSQIRTININPAVAVGPWKGFSLGIGFNAETARGVFGQHFALPTIPIMPPGDIDAEIRMNDWAFGWNAGLLYEHEDIFRIGVGYRSQIDHTIEGTARFHTPAISGVLPIDLPSLTVDADARAGLLSPQSVTASAVWNIADYVQVLGDVQWTDWSSFQVLQTDLSNYRTTIAGTVVSIDKLIETYSILEPIKLLLPQRDTIYENFRDTWRATVGLQLFPSEKLTLRLGGGFDQSPVYNANRTLRLPDGNRWIIATGFGIEVLKGIYADFGYAHYFLQDGTLDETNQTLDASHLVATVSSAANVYALQITYNWQNNPWSDLEL